MLFSLTSISFATDSSTVIYEPEDFYVGEIDDGNLFTLQTDNKSVAILTSDDKHLIDISIKYANNPDTAYQWKIEDYSVSTFIPTNVSFGTDIIQYAENNLSDANVVDFEDITYDEPIEVPQTRSSAGADLLPALAKLLGSEYTKKLKHTETYKGQVFRGYQAMDFRILTNGSKSWSKKISVSSMIVSVLGLVASSTLVGAVCNAFGVALSAASLLPAGKINKYLCLGMEYRYVTVNNSKYIYDNNDKTYEYKGYENASNNNKERAYIDSGAKIIRYTDGATYYNSYTQQIQSAYTMFQRIGQMA